MTSRDIHENEPVYLRDLDGTGSMHVCSREDPGARQYLPSNTAPDMTHTDEQVEKFLIEKRGLYYRPDASGYTGLKRDAGRYTFEEAAERVGPNGPDGAQDGLGMWTEEEAPEYSSACAWDVKMKDQAYQAGYNAALSAMPAPDAQAIRNAALEPVLWAAYEAACEFVEPDNRVKLGVAMAVMGGGAFYSQPDDQDAQKILDRVRSYLDNLDGEAGLTAHEVDHLCGLAFGRTDIDQPAPDAVSVAEADEMRFVNLGYKAAWADAENGVRAYDPRVILSKARALTKGDTTDD